MTTPRFIAGYERPCLDTLVALWLAERYLCLGEPTEIAFLRAYPLAEQHRLAWFAQPRTVPALFPDLFDSGRRKKRASFIDHYGTSATGTIWTELLDKGRPVAHLVDLVNAVHGDAFRGSEMSSTAPRESMRASLMRIYARASRRATDLARYQVMRDWLCDDTLGFQAHHPGAARLCDDTLRRRKILVPSRAGCRWGTQRGSNMRTPKKVRHTRAAENTMKPHPNKAILPAEGKLPNAVKLIEGNCGPHAGKLLLSVQPALAARDIATLSHTSPEYQRHVLDRICAGHSTPLKKTAACALVYETVAFREVISRMERALGGVRREIAFVVTQIEAGMSGLDRGPDRLLTLSLVVESARNIADSIHQLPHVGSGPASIRRATALGQEVMEAASSKLHAAAALGLLAKNARNVPILKPEHHPTAQEQGQAVDLCRAIVAVAQPVVRAARKKWGNLDAEQRVRARAKVTQRIITHADPDGDALVSAWLVERYLFADEAVEILFVPRARVLGCLRIGDCLVDVGNTYDPARFLFDHKPPAMPSRHDSCATKLVWEHLLALGHPLEHLEDLVLAVFAWDCVKRRKEFGNQAQASKKAGFHAALTSAQQAGLNNAALYRHMRRWLNRTSSAVQNTK